MFSDSKLNHLNLITFSRLKIEPFESHNVLRLKNLTTFLDSKLNHLNVITFSLGLKIEPFESHIVLGLKIEPFESHNILWLKIEPIKMMDFDISHSIRKKIILWAQSKVLWRQT